MNDTCFDTRHRAIHQILDDRPIVFEAYADHHTSDAFVTGAPISGWRDVDFAALHAVMRQAETVLVDTVGGHALSDPFIPVVVLANVVREHDGLRKGQIIATEPYSGVFLVLADSPVQVTFDRLRSVDATFASTEPG